MTEERPIAGRMEEGEILLLLAEGKAIRSETMAILRDLTSGNVSVLLLSLIFPFSIARKAFESQGIPLEKIFFIDTLTKYSTGPHVDPVPQCVFLTSPADVTELGIAITRLLPAMPQGRQCIMLDDLSMMLLYSNSTTVLKFVHFLTSKIRLMGKNGIILTTATAPDPFMMAQLQILVDSVVMQPGADVPEEPAAGGSLS